MKKELLICVFIIACIILLDVLITKHTNASLESINNNLIELKEDIVKNEKFDMSKMKEIDKQWNDEFKLLACYLEHDELEKIKTQLVIISSGMEMEDRVLTIEEIDKAIYIIQHVESKQTLQLDNIF